MNKFKPEDWPLDVRASSARYTYVLRVKFDVSELQVCHPVVIKRERSFGREEKIDVIHALEDGTVRHTPIP